MSKVKYRVRDQPDECLQSIDCEISEKLEALTKQIRLLGIGSRTF